MRRIQSWEGCLKFVHPTTILGKETARIWAFLPLALQRHFSQESRASSLWNLSYFLIPRNVMDSLEIKTISWLKWKGMALLLSMLQLPWAKVHGGSHPPGPSTAVSLPCS